MPYSGADDESLPEHVKKMPAKVKSAWVKAFNAMHSECQEAKGDDCEGKAMRGANAMAKRMQEKENMQTGFLFVELASLSDGKSFDGLAAGKFIDMNGREVRLEAGDFDEFVANTLAAIEATRSEGGELVGLPIDARDHDKGDGAGWIVAAERDGSKIRLTPKWTEIGLDLIGKGIRRFFSATIDLANKVILGGTLTNWPATRDGKGKLLLRPIELQSRLLELEDSKDAQISKVRMAFQEQMDSYHQPMPMDPGVWVLEVYDDYVICRSGEQLYRIAYQQTEDGITFAARAEWVEVKQEYVEAILGETIMTIQLSELTPEDRAALVAELREQLKPDLAPPGGEPATTTTSIGGASHIAGVFDLSGLSDEAKKQREAEIGQLIANARSQAELEYRAKLVQLQHEGKMTELAQKATGGSDDAPRGFPVSAEELQKHLVKLAPDEAKFWAELLERTVKGGLVDFGERGHSRRMQGTAELSAQIKPILAKALADGMSLEDFFAANPELGARESYNLTEFAKEK